MRSVRPLRALVAILLAFSLAACATSAALTVRERSTRAIVIGHTGAAALQDAAHTLCQPPASQPWTCASPVAASAFLTDARWQSLNRVLSRFFAIEIDAATAMRAWRAGDPAPKALAEYFAVAAEILAVARDLHPDLAARIIAHALDLERATNELKSLEVQP